MKFVDEVTLTVGSGKGGAGCISFHRQAMMARGGPDGGDGGKGGSVIFRVNPAINTLLNYRFKKKFFAKDGTQGSGRDKSGGKGEDVILEVPRGTIIKDEDGKILFDLSEPGDHVFLEGGRGGKGNAFFKNSVNQAPEYAQPGEPGEERKITLELKLLADVGVIGYPNAGKSTFISRVSAAKPKIADYPFTTLAPNLGVVEFDNNAYVVADIPGLVPGAHKGVGLGIQFLRHIERTNLFVHLIDASGTSGRDPLQDFYDINYELKEYDKSKAGSEGFNSLSEREQLVVLNKIDTLSPEQQRELKERFTHEKIDVQLISAVSGQGLKELISEVGRRVLGKRD